MKTLVLTFILLSLGLGASAQDFHSLWIVPRKTEARDANVIGKGVVCKCGNDIDITIPVEKISAGSYIEWDFSVNAVKNAPELYSVEYFDGGNWKALYTLNCSHKAIRIKEPFTQLNTIKLDSPIEKGNLQLRLRAVSQGEGSIRFVSSDNTAMSVRYLGTQAPKDTTRVLCIGNSFTYVAGASWMLKEIAWSQGHYLDLQASLRGGRTFGQHLGMYVTGERIKLGNYDYAFFQNQSQANALYCQDKKANAGILNDGVLLAARVRESSPGVKIFLESTWAYPGKNNGGFASVKEFDRLLAKGSKKMARSMKAGVSPIGKAFAVCRAERPDINLYAKDDKHQSEYGAYLKACVNYLMMFGTAFDGKVHDCSLDPQKTAYLRSVAERTVKVKK